MKATIIRRLITAALAIVLGLSLPACFESFHKPGVGTYIALGTDSEEQEIDLVRGIKRAKSVNQSKSTEHVARTVNSLGTGWILADAYKATEAGKRAVESDNITAGTKGKEIDSATTLGIEKEKTTRLGMELEAAPPAP